MKAFVEEEGRDDVLAALTEAEIAAISRLGYVECRAAFARAKRERRLTDAQERTADRALDQRWGQLAVVELDNRLMHEAASLTRSLALRGADAVHLASAIVVAGPERSDTTFACWDARLAEAAGATGFTVVGAS